MLCPCVYGDVWCKLFEQDSSFWQHFSSVSSLLLYRFLRVCSLGWGQMCSPHETNSCFIVSRMNLDLQVSHLQQMQVLLNTCIKFNMDVIHIDIYWCLVIMTYYIYRSVQRTDIVLVRPSPSLKCKLLQRFGRESSVTFEFTFPKTKMILSEPRNAHFWLLPWHIQSSLISHSMSIGSRCYRWDPLQMLSVTNTTTSPTILKWMIWFIVGWVDHSEVQTCSPALQCSCYHTYPKPT